MIIRSKKSLGQHFLRDRNILQKIVGAAGLTASDTILEVGPGEGTLTKFLLAHAGKVVAVEKDDRLIPVLQKRFASEITSGKLTLVHQDILLLDSRFMNHESRFKIVANIPYYITGQFLRKFIQSNAQPSMMVLLLQKEVAKRIVAADGKESILSISVKCYGTPEYIGTVKAGSFSPPPKVDSAILKIEDISKKFFAGFTEEKFFKVLKRGFSHPRKFLSGNLGLPASVLPRCGILEKARAENVSLEQWRCLTMTQELASSAPAKAGRYTQDRHKKGTVHPAECSCRA